MIQKHDIHTVLAQAKATLKENQMTLIDAEILLANALQCRREYLFAYPEKIIPNTVRNLFLGTLSERLKGKPLAYITGKKEFWGLDFIVNENVLIPRPETEGLVEHVLAKIKHKNFQHKALLDLGTGSGCIAIALAKSLPEWQIIGVDNSSKALDVAQQNARQHNYHNLNFLESDWFCNIQPQKFSVIISNPPYIDSEDTELEQNVKKFEPINALIASNNGLANYQIIISKAKDYLTEDGFISFEMGYRQAGDIKKILIENNFGAIEIKKDLQNFDRYLFAE